VCAQALQVGDEIIQFGSVSAANFVNMQSIAAVVEHSKGVSTTVTSHLYVICMFLRILQTLVMHSPSGVK